MLTQPTNQNLIITLRFMTMSKSISEMQFNQSLSRKAEARFRLESGKSVGVFRQVQDDLDRVQIMIGASKVDLSYPDAKALVSKLTDALELIK